jgi:aspartate aminotransferase-like enzyme
MSFPNGQSYNPQAVSAPLSSVTFRIAEDASELEQVFQLGYETFVEEIPQHPPNAARRHVDRFHDQNTYLVAVSDGIVVGMLAVRAERPFSLDEKLGNVDPYLPPGRRVCELRLLAVRRAFRKGLVFKGLVDLLLDYGRARGYDLAVISGTVRQERLYRHLGFVPFGPLVGSEDARFQPMYLTIERLWEAAPVLRAPRSQPLSFLPGPVMVSDEVRAAFERPPVSHRAGQFKDDFARTRTRLRDLVRAERAAIMLGSATLANDAVGAQLSLLGAPGVVVSNGEFGERLIDHARRFGLTHTALEFGWGEVIDAARVERAIERTGARWMWAVASETSTGMLNDLGVFKSLSARHGLKLCLDCVSAIGAVPMDLGGVYLATGASGKALASLPGLAIVFHHAHLAPAPTRLPRYLDLGYYAEKDGIPFTHSSNLVAALDAAVARFDGSTEPFDRIAELSRWIRPQLRELGLPILVDGDHASPAVVTIPLAPDQSAAAIGDHLQQRGLLIAYQSEYLRQRNWLQIGLMGECSRRDLERLLGELGALIPRAVLRSGRR